MNWPVAVNKYFEFQKRGPHWSGKQFDYKKASNSLRTVLLSKKHQSEGAFEYTKERTVGKDRKTKWRFFQLPTTKLAAFQTRPGYHELLPQEDNFSNEVTFLIFNSVIDYFNHRADGVPFYHYVTMECTWWYFHGILVHRKLCRLTRFSWEWRVKISLSIFMACFMAWTHGVQLMQWNCASIWFSWGVKMLANHSRDLAGEGGGGGGLFGNTIWVYNYTFSCLKQGRPRKASSFLPFRSHIFADLCVKMQTYVP